MFSETDKKNDDTEYSSPENYSNELNALQAVLAALKPLKPGARKKLLKTIMAFFEINMASNISDEAYSSYRGHTEASGDKPVPTFSENRNMSPKEFMLQKQPRTDVERVACLAYYLTHYKSTPHFKTLDISKLNTDAAQIKFSNPARAADHATQYGYLVPTTRGQKQLSAGGELFVQALPDYTLAKEAMMSARPRKNKSSIRKRSNHDNLNE